LQDCYYFSDHSGTSGFTVGAASLFGGLGGAFYIVIMKTRMVNGFKLILAIGIKVLYNKSTYLLI
jgi:hypothetical protein